jgi:hypothetical protein
MIDSTEHAEDCDGDCDSVEAEPGCADGLAHRWTAKGEGGCSQNPGVWSLGGTTYQFSRHCCYCGARRVEIRHGWQRNPDECDSIRYEGGERDEVAIADALRAARRRDMARRRRARAIAPSIADAIDLSRATLDPLIDQVMRVARVRRPTAEAIVSEIWKLRLARAAGRPAQVQA